ncbi:hypothetical protein PsYK624_033290 [Phanerochaete sordida]|uniref:Uncharacterized protein n=1 Tax=Phanerochaete sordida TaxID=48140 RepID=A0A9P3G2U5_9APHY|nr:hypothetical protein PsYK624_033290 [Phanerochaete sordida]
MDVPDLRLLTDAVALIGLFVSSELVLVILEGIVFGVYTLLVLFTMVVIVRSRGALTVKKSLLLSACGVMYASAAAHLGVSMWYLFEDNRRSGAIQAMAVDCLLSLADDVVCSSLKMPRSYEDTAAHSLWVMATQNVLLSTNMMLSDIVVLWRAWVLWPGRRMIQAISVIMTVGALGMLLWTCSVYSLYQAVTGSISLCISWLTNLWSTLLIAARAWQHRRHIGPLQATGSRTRAEMALLLFIESGVLYCMLWVPLVGASVKCLATWSDPNCVLPGGAIKFMDSMVDIQLGCLVSLVGIYPTAVILLIQLTDHYAQKTLSLDGMPTIFRQQLSVLPGSHGETSAARPTALLETHHAENSGRRNADIQITTFIRRSVARSITDGDPVEKPKP